MKPHIAVYPSTRGEYWTCVGEGRLGIGRSVAKAYWNWLGMKVYAATVGNLVLMLGEDETRH